jgi:penicillin G amidase
VTLPVSRSHRRLRVAIVIVLVSVLVVVALGVGALAWVTGRALPQVSGDLRVPGLNGPVTVTRDVHGIVDIIASDPHDLFLAQGYVHAQERMWQMEVWRHISAGRLAELFGAGSLDIDRVVRTIGWRHAAERDLADASPLVHSTLDAYAAGVNAWLDANRERLGLAFVITGDDPEPWTPLDTLTWGKVQAWNLGGNMDTEIFRYLADARLGDPARTDEILAPREFGPVIVPTEGTGATEASGPVEVPGGPVPSPAPRAVVGAAAGDAWLGVASAASAALRLAGLDASGGGLASDHGIGSNSWAISPELSATGAALLANDPHLGISMPSIWFINGLHCATVDAACPYDVSGVSFPGAPGVILGHNARIAWGSTNAGPDVQDLVVETIDPADPSRYVGPDGATRPFTVRTEVIEVKGGDPVRLTVRETGHGPILNDVDPRLADAPLMALRWTATDPAAGPDGTVETFLKLDVATDWTSFREALSGFLAPGQNFTYADVDGHIGYQLAGYVPVRSDPDDRGDRPVSGSDGTGEWVGRIPFDKLPTRHDPGEGWIVTANNAIVDDGYPGFLGQEWDPGYRAERIIDLVNLAAEDGVTVEEMGRVQADSSPLRARDVVLRLEGAEPATEDGRTIAQRITAWNGDCETESLGCAAYMTWEYHLLRAVFDDDLGLGLAREYVGSPISWVALERLLDDPSAAWWDDIRTPPLETADQVILGAMDAAGADLRASYGDPDRWTWGRLHTATFQEATIGANSGIGPLEWYFNDGPVAVAGAAGAPNATYYRFERAYPDPTDPAYEPVGITDLFSVTNLPSYRLLIDLSDLDGARIVTTTGQSGNPFDRHYNDMIDHWRLGETLPFPFSRAAVAAAAATTLQLLP